MIKKLDKIYKRSLKIPINDKTKIVIMSDCHRGSGDNFDNFLKNKNIYVAALMHYFDNGFTYIELGDGDDLWETKNYQNIIDQNIDIFTKLKKFHDLDRLVMIYGNHDMEKKSKSTLEKYFYKYYNKSTKQEESLLNSLKVHESIVLTYNNYEMFLIHGHQADFLNSTLWRLSYFLVRYIWRSLESIGVKAPNRSAKNHIVTKRVEKKLKKWSIKNNKILIAGHTHKSIFPKKGHSLYFNDGSCIHPNGITCLEIENGNISLVKWEYKLNEKKLITVERIVLDGNEPLSNFY